MVFCDLPYGVTACAWDSIIPFDKLWAAYKRVVKPHGSIILTATGLFEGALKMSNPDWYRHEWVWDKIQPVGFQIAKYRPMQRHEIILVFSQDSPKYFPVVEELTESHIGGGAKVPSEVSPISKDDGFKREYFYKYPQSILTGEGNIIRVSKGGQRHDHPSQKPVPLLAWLIQNYSREGDTVLDNTMGSGSTGVACVRENRNFIGIEKDPEYFEVCKRRIQEAEEGLLAGVHHVFGTDSTGVLISRIVPEDTRQPRAIEEIGFVDLTDDQKRLRDEKIMNAARERRAQRDALAQPTS